MQKYKTVLVPEELAEEVHKQIAEGQHRSLSEFVSEAIRDRLLSTKHVWAQTTPQGTVKIGITEHFQRQLNEVVNLQTDKIGGKVSIDEPFGVVETWWFVHDLYPPVAGEIVAVNERVVEDPFTLNTDPYQWIVEVKPIP